MSLELIPYGNQYAEAWDEFCLYAQNATILHTRRFLGYHGERFTDTSLLVQDSGKLVGLFPAAQSLSDTTLIVSHPGITYGGLVQQGKLGGLRMISLLETIIEYYANTGYSYLHYKPVPFVYSTALAQDDLYALFCLGAKRVRCELSCSIDLQSQRTLSERRRRGLKKAQAAVVLSSDSKYLPDLWRVISNNLARRHNAQPVHSLEELLLLHRLFPDQIQSRCALIDGVVEAGVVFFNAARVWHAQYIAASEVAYDVSALDAVFDGAIQEARQSGARYFDFGTSNENNGLVLNDGLYRYKSEFGGGGLVHEMYELDLTQCSRL